MYSILNTTSCSPLTSGVSEHRPKTTTTACRVVPIAPVARTVQAIAILTSTAQIRPPSLSPLMTFPPSDYNRRRSACPPAAVHALTPQHVRPNTTSPFRRAEQSTRPPVIRSRRPHWAQDRACTAMMTLTTAKPLTATLASPTLLRSPRAPKVCPVCLALPVALPIAFLCVFQS